MSPSARDRRRGGIADDDVRRVGLGQGAAPSSFTIDGHTYAEGGSILPTCTVNLYLADGTFVSTTTSNGAGYFSFTVSDSTTLHYLTATRFGFVQAESAHTVVGGQTVDLTLAAQHAAGRKLWRDYEESLERQRQEEGFELIIAVVTAYEEDRRCRLLKAC